MHNNDKLAAQLDSGKCSEDEISSYANDNKEGEKVGFISDNVKLIILLSGKRKSGKDYISSRLTDHIGEARSRYLAILRIAGPIKKEFARNNELDFSKLLDSSCYKENFRRAMVEWSEKHREEKGWNCFLEQAIREQNAKDKVIWILNDARRLCDIEYFEGNPSFTKCKIIKLRIEASDEVRTNRGWEFVAGIDDKDTECGLDLYKDWTYVIKNDTHDREDSLASALKPILDAIDDALKDLVQEST